MNNNKFKIGQKVNYSGKNYLISHIEDGYVQIKDISRRKIIDLFNHDINKISK